MNNQANIAYSYAGGTGTETASSNITTTTLLDEYSLVATKTALTATYRPGEDLTYVIRLENSGMIESYWGNENAGARRRYYHLTEKGRELFYENQADWRKYRSIISELFGMEDASK